MHNMFVAQNAPCPVALTLLLAVLFLKIQQKHDNRY